LPAAERLKPFLTGRIPAEHEARAILASYGVKGPPEVVVPAEAGTQPVVDAAVGIGFPVVLKCLVAGMIHKSDAGLVKLRLGSAEAVRDAANDMLSRTKGKPVLGLLVQRMASPVAEILVGARVDPDFGSLIVVGAGGVNVELYKDVAVRVAPITEEEALAALGSTRISRVLDGWRGAPPGDRAAAAKTIAALSRFIADFAAEVREVEINPLAVLEAGKGGLALDCVIAPRS
jgi:succinyl-CoA synthetase beta subunit